MICQGASPNRRFYRRFRICNLARVQLRRRGRELSGWLLLTHTADKMRSDLGEAHLTERIAQPPNFRLRVRRKRIASMDTEIQKTARPELRPFGPCSGFSRSGLHRSLPAAASQGIEPFRFRSSSFFTGAFPFPSLPKISIASGILARRARSRKKEFRPNRGELLRHCHVNELIQGDTLLVGGSAGFKILSRPRRNWELA